MSPVCSQPSRTAAAVASGFRQYPGKTFGPRTSSSLSSDSDTSTYGYGLPAYPTLRTASSGGRQRTLGAASVRP